MATIPDRIEAAVDAVIAKIAAEEPAASTQWGTDDADPIDAAEATEWSDSSHSHYELTVLNITGVKTASDGRELKRSRGKRLQKGTLVIRTHVYERTKADLGQSQVRHARKVQNWIEAIDAEGSFSSRGWRIDWDSWEGIRDDSGRAPNPGVRIECTLEVNQ